MTAQPKVPAWALLRADDLPNKRYDFQRPSLIETNLLRPADFVKLAFHLDDAGDYISRLEFWVEVREILDSGGFLGRIDNTLPTEAGCSEGDLIYFGPEHVLRSPNDKPRLAPSGDA